MNLNKDRFDKALSLALETREVTQFPATALVESVRTFLKRHQVPDELLDFFEQYSFSEAIPIGSSDFGPVNDLANLNERYKGCIDEGLLVIGSSLNGDAIVLSLKNNWTVGYVSHDLLWEKQQIRSALTPFDIGSFSLASALYEFDSDAEEEIDDYTSFPSDYDSTQEQNERGGWDADFPL